MIGQMPSGQPTTASLSLPHALGEWVFLCLCLALIIAVFGAVYAWRMLLFATRDRTALGEHLAERERIARELHDELLQSVQGLLLGVESIVYELPDRELVQRHLKESVGRARASIVEARDKVRDFRNGAQLDTLAEVLAQTANRILSNSPLDVRVTVNGKPRRIDALVFNELKSIVGEMLQSFEHYPNTGRVMIAIAFGRRALVLDIVHDCERVELPGGDGNEREAYCGRADMLARARKIGAELTVDPRRDAGAAVKIIVPGRRAYAHKPLWWA